MSSIHSNYLGVHELEYLDKAPSKVELIPGRMYILASWHSNTHIKAKEHNEFEVIAHYGNPLKLGDSYLWNYAVNQE